MASPLPRVFKCSDEKNKSSTDWSAHRDFVALGLRPSVLSGLHDKLPGKASYGEKPSPCIVPASIDSVRYTSTDITAPTPLEATRKGQKSVRVIGRRLRPILGSFLKWKLLRFATSGFFSRCCFAHYALLSIAYKEGHVLCSIEFLRLAKVAWMSLTRLPNRATNTACCATPTRSAGCLC